MGWVCSEWWGIRLGDWVGGWWLVVGVHIRCCGNGGYWFRSYSGSLGEAPSNQTLLPLSFGASPRLGMPSFRSCSVGPPPSAIHGRGRLTRHPCRVAHCAEPPLGLTRGRPPPQHREAAYRPACHLKRTRSTVGAGLPAMVVNDDACGLNERGVWTSIAGKPAPTGDSR